MTTLWLIFWGIFGTPAIIFANMASAPHLNAWAIALVIAVACDLGYSASGGLS